MRPSSIGQRTVAINHQGGALFLPEVKERAASVKEAKGRVLAARRKFDVFRQKTDGAPSQNVGWSHQCGGMFGGEGLPGPGFERRHRQNCGLREPALFAFAGDFPEPPKKWIFRSDDTPNAFLRADAFERDVYPQARLMESRDFGRRLMR